MTNSNLEHALKYISIGWRVFPINKDKRPLTSNGFKDATNDEKRVRAWWKKHPHAGIGVATGKVSGIVVLDADLQKEEAQENLAHLIKTRGSFEQTVVAQSGGGGLHFYFKHPGSDIKVSNAQNFMGFHGIDVRGDGGYIIVPPTLHKSGNKYSWGDEQSPFEEPLPECPEYLYSNDDTTAAFSRFNFSGLVEDGERNATLTSIAGLLRSMGLEADAIYRILAEQNLTRCVPPLDDTEVRTIADNIVKYDPFSTRNNVQAPTRFGLDNLLRFPYTDVGFASMIEMSHFGQIKYNHTKGQWLIWDEHVWRSDDVNEILLKATDTTTLFRQAVDLITDDDQRRSALKYSIKMQNIARLTAGIQIAKAIPSISTTLREWNVHKDLLACENGVVDLKTGSISPGKPDDLLSIKIPHKLEPDAICPTWEKFLEDIFDNDLRMVQFIQTAIGYSLTGHTTEQCLFLLVGKGANGKSTMLEVLKHLLGSYSYTAPFSTFERQPSGQSQTNDLAVLHDKRLVMASEPSDGVVINDGRIKHITGGDTITARFLYQEWFEYEPTFKIWLATNNLPRVKDDSDGFWRRVRKVDFKVRFWDEGEAPPNSKLKDPFLLQKLKDETPGILNWALRGAKEWYENGLSTPKTVTRATRDYREESDPLHTFLQRHVVPFPESLVTIDEMYHVYAQFAKKAMLKNFEVLSRSKFGQSIRQRFTVKTIKSVQTVIDTQLTALEDFDNESSNITMRWRKKE